jgi:beta-glucosidase
MANYMDYRMGVLAGQDLWDGYSMGMNTLDGLDKDPAIVTAVQRATKNIAYSITHSHAMNVGNATVVAVTPWWQMALYILIGVLAVATAGCAFMMIKSKKKAA